MYHVYPLNDEREHELQGTTCPCGPRVEWNDPKTGEAYAEPLVIHNAFDSAKHGSSPSDGFADSCSLSGLRSTGECKERGRSQHFQRLTLALTLRKFFSRVLYIPFIVRLPANLKTHWRNWQVRGTGKAYRTLTKAMRDDPTYAHSWMCNIAMPIYDGAKGKLTIHEANAIADDLMVHLFGVKKPNNQAQRPLANSDVVGGKETMEQPNGPDERPERITPGAQDNQKP